MASKLTICDPESVMAYFIRDEVYGDGYLDLSIWVGFKGMPNGFLQRYYTKADFDMAVMNLLKEMGVIE